MLSAGLSGTVKSRGLFVLLTRKSPNTHPNARLSVNTEAGTGLGRGESGAEERNLAKLTILVYGHWSTFQ